MLSPVHTSNIVEATGNKVDCCFDIVASVDLALRESYRPGLEPATCKSQVHRPTAEPPRNSIRN